MEQTSIFDFIPDGDRFKPIKSTDWKWSFEDYPKEKNGLKVFSCFACGGGSTMGYKLAGCEVVGCVEIDPMSVPPLMIKRIVTRLIESEVFK